MVEEEQHHVRHDEGTDARPGRGEAESHAALLVEVFGEDHHRRGVDETAAQTCGRTEIKTKSKVFIFDSSQGSLDINDSAGAEDNESTRICLTELQHDK